jgi:hypothetical protein
MKESEGLYRSFTFVKQALLGIGALILVLLVFGYLFFMRNVDAPKAWSAADREIQGGMLHFGERVQRKAKVYERRPTDYFRASSGVLYATNDRLIFIGIAPTNQLESEDEYPNDTLLSISHRRIFLLTAHGAVITHPGRAPALFGSKRGEEKALDDLIDYVNADHAAQRAAAASEARLRQAVAAMVRQPLYYVVKRGDALSSIANKFGATGDQIKSWNKLPNDKVRIGERLLVKPAGK